MMDRRETETEPEFLEALGRLIRREIDPYSEGLEHVGRTGAARHGPVAVLRDGNAGRGHDDGRGGGDVEGAQPVAAGAAGVGDAREIGLHGMHPRPQCVGHARDLFRRFSAVCSGCQPSPERFESRHVPRVARIENGTVENGINDLSRLLAVERCVEAGRGGGLRIRGVGGRGLRLGHWFSGRILGVRPKHTREENPGMPRKVIIDVDAGIDDAVALSMALFDPRLEVRRGLLDCLLEDLR